MKKKELLKKLHLKKGKKMSGIERFILGLVIFGVLLVLYLIGQFTYYNLPQNPVADYLPKEETVAYLEINDLRLPNKIQNKIEEDQIKLEQNIIQIFGAELTPMLNTFAKDHLALALVQDEGLNNHPLLFVDAKSRNRALKYFRSLLLPGEEFIKTYDEETIYSYSHSHPFSFKLVDRYVVIARTPQALSFVSASEERKHLQSDEKYQVSIDNLPRNKWIFGYINFRKLNFSDNPAINNIVEPLKHVMHHLALTVRKDQEGFHFNTYLNLNKNLLSLEHGESERKFAYELTDYILDENVALYLGGANLEAEWLNTLETISNLNPAYGVILEGILRAQSNEIFGEQVDLRNDLYPLFEGEYAIAISQGKLGKTISLILSHEDRDFVNKKMEKLANGFKFLAAKFAPQIKVVTLPDGTESRELVPDDSKVTISEENYGGYKLYCTEVTNTATGFCYTVTDEIVIMTSSKDTIVKTIDLKNSNGKFLSASSAFRKTLSNLSKVSDEVSFLNFDHFSALNADNKYIQAALPLLSKLEAVSWVKHYFTDGVSTEGYILVK